MALRLLPIVRGAGAGGGAGYGAESDWCPAGGGLGLRVGAPERAPAGVPVPVGSSLSGHTGRDFRHCAFAAGNAVGAGDVPAAGDRPRPRRQTKVRSYRDIEP